MVWKLSQGLAIWRCTPQAIPAPTELMLSGFRKGAKPIIILILIELSVEGSI